MVLVKGFVKKDLLSKGCLTVINIKEIMMTMTLLMRMMAITMMTTMKMMMQVGPGDSYLLTVGGFNGALSTLGDGMTPSSSHWNINGMRFSTKCVRDLSNIMTVHS